MIELILAPSAVCFILLVSLSTYVFCKNPKKLPNISFSFATGSLALVELGKFMFLLNPLSFKAGIWLKCFWGGLVLVPVAWVLFSLIFARDNFNLIFSKWRWGIAGISFISAFAILTLIKDNKAVYPAIVGNTPGIFIGPNSYFMSIYLMLSFVLVIVNFENTFKNASGPVKRQIKYALIGIIGTFSFYIYVISEALLYSFISVKLLFAGACITIILSLILFFSIIRYRLLDVNVFISRYVIYRSVSILAVGIYLLLTGTLLNLTKILGGNLYQYLKPVAVFIAVVLLAAILLSDRIRRKIQVSINKNFFANKYDYRFVWTQFTEKLGYNVKIDEMLPAIAEMIAGIMWVESVSIWLYDEDYKCYQMTEQFNLSEVGQGIINSTDPIIKLLEQEEVLDLLIAPSKNSFMNESKTAAFLAEKLKARVIVPMNTRDKLMGFITVGKVITDESFNDEDYELLQTLAKQSASMIQNARLSEKLIVSQQMESVTKVASFIIHDLKNLISTLDILLDNSKEYIENHEFQEDLIITLDNTVAKMRKMMEKVSTAPQETNFDFQTVNLVSLVNSSIEEIHLKNNPKIELRGNYKEDNLVYISGDKKSLTKVFSNILINAMQALPLNGGIIEINIEEDKEKVIFSIADNGNGISDEFMKRNLFKPFQTTKNGGLGIGLFQCKTILSAHKGAKIDVESELGKGTKFIISFPVSERGALN